LNYKEGKAGHENDEEITIFKSIGLAVVDIIVANYLYEKVVECGMGLSFERLPFDGIFL